MTTGIAIDPELLPVVDEVEQEVGRRVSQTHQLHAVRCRIRQREVGLQIDSSPSLDAMIKAELIACVQEIFSVRGYAEQATHVVVEPYRMGSAFLVETIEVSE